jgi:hypothetical protein
VKPGAVTYRERCGARIDLDVEAGQLRERR